jgi:hypothetical protein
VDARGGVQHQYRHRIDRQLITVGTTFGTGDGGT